MTVFYDNWCKNCSRFMKFVHKADWLNIVFAKELRNENHTKSVVGLNLKLAHEQLASVNAGSWKYGYDSLYRIFLRIPIFWLLIPIFWLLKISKLGQYFYIQLAVNRQIVPLHCADDVCR